MLNLAHVLEVFSAENIVRGSGMAAYLLLFSVIAGGMLLSVKWIPDRWRKGFLSYHRLLSLAAIVMVLIHGAAFFIGKYDYLALTDVLLPFGAKHQPWEFAAGIIAVYTMVIIAISSVHFLMKAMGWQKWRIAHHLAFPCYFLSLWHSAALAKPSHLMFLSLFYPATASVVIALALLQVWKALERRRAASGNTTGGR
jgi:DMSO/TMAO reductase YedYZ heme-binding membrane subunit